MVESTTKAIVKTFNDPACFGLRLEVTVLATGAVLTKVHGIRFGNEMDIPLDQLTCLNRLISAALKNVAKTKNGLKKKLDKQTGP